MSTLWTLSCLYSLNTSSPDFLRRLYSLFRHDEEEQYLSNLQGFELARLLNFLDQTLSAIPANRDISRICLHKLQDICSNRATLPSSHVVSDGIARVGGGPVAVGAITDVWEGTYLTRKVRIKRLKIPPNDDQTLKKSFLEAAVMWKRLRHPNIVPFVGVAMNPLQIVSEWMSNGTLIEFVNENPGANRISLVLDVAEGLDYLHANHIIHGSLDGSRILVGRDCHARLTDIEVSSIVRGVSSAAHENEHIAAWAALEILKGGGTITREADVFGFGMVVIEAFTGRHPFSKFTVPVITSETIDGRRPARPQEAQRPGLTDSVWDVTDRCWRHDPAQRPTMRKVVRLLRECSRTVAWRPRITDIPARLFIDGILPFCDTKDMLSLGCTNRFFALITGDYDFARSEAARTSGWKFIYGRLGDPRVFVWGDKDYGRLGLSQFPQATFPDVPFPVELHLPGVRVVSLAMSRSSLYMLGADGSVYVCGALNIPYDSSSKPKGFSDPCATTQKPLKLQLPAPTRSISCGYFHALILDASSTVWNLTSWGRPFRLVSPSLDCSSPKTTPVQIGCGSAFSTVLTKSGDVYAWWLFGGPSENRYREGVAELDKDGSAKGVISDDGMVIPCHTWEIDMNPVKLPILPDLPDLPGTGLPEEERRKETRLVKIAALTRNLVGSTNKGHVLLLDGMDRDDSTRSWRYLPNYSEVGKVKEHPAFHATTGNDGQERPPEVEFSSDIMLITRVSADVDCFFAYSSSIVLMGRFDATPETLPTIIPRLQNRSVTSVFSGYNHFGALTSSGKLLTWGNYSHGALGLGDPGKLPVGSPGGYANEEERVGAHNYPPDVTVPTEVRFNHGLRAEGRVKRYCFTAAAGGWSTAALVVDLAEDEVPPEGLK